MINKKQVEKKINTALTIAEKYHLDHLVNEFRHLKDRSDKYNIHVLFIGSFSTGKSALLNRLIGKNILAVNQAPETALAAELYFSENEQIFANFSDGTRRTVDDINTVDSSDVRNVEYYLNSENLKKCSEYILVDTPGFDSGIEKHNKALMQYIDVGTAFVLVIDCDQGTISESALKYLEEASRYSDNIAVIINKCDKKIESEIKEIKSYIEKRLFGSVGMECPIFCMSAYDDDTDKKILELLNCFVPQQLYEEEILLSFSNQVHNLISALYVIRESRKCDVDDIDKEIEKREELKKHIQEQFQIQKNKVAGSLYRNTKDSIMQKIEGNLMANADVLREAYQGGTGLFQSTVVEMIRPIMVEEMEKYSNSAYTGALERIKNDFSAQSAEAGIPGNLLSDVCEKVSALRGTEGFLVPAGQTDLAVDLKASNALYKMVGSILAIVSSVLAPEIELLILFLPEIVTVLSAITGNTRESRLEEEIKSSVIPKVMEKLKEYLDNSLEKIEDEIIRNIEANINEMLTVENQALEKIKAIKSGRKEEYQKFIETVDNDIEYLRRQV